MPSPLGDDQPSPDASRPRGLAGVFKGLASTKLSRSPFPLTPQVHPTSAPPTLASVNAYPAGLRGFSACHMVSFEQLRHGTLSERVDAASKLRQAVTEYPLSPVLEIWHATKDMIEPGNPPATRTAGWELLSECAQHASSSDLERKEYFQTLTAPTNPDDFQLQLTALVHLTRNGRVLSGFDYEVLPLLSSWLHMICAERRERQRSRASNASPRPAITAKEKNIAQIFAFILDVIKFSSNVADEASIRSLMDGLLGLCMTSSVRDELRSCIAVLDAIVTFASIPSEKLRDCVLVLGSIHCLVPALQKESWNTLSMLCRSHNGQRTVRILLDILRNAPPEGTDDMILNRDLRGALSVLRKLLSKSTEKGFPTVPFSLLVDGLASALKMTTSVKAQDEILKLINLIFDPGDGAMHPMAVDEDWSVVLEVAYRCSARAADPAYVAASPLGMRTLQSPGSSTSSLSGASTRDEQDRPDEVIGLELLRLVTRLETLMLRAGPQQFIPRQTVVGFFTRVHSFLPDSAACVVLDYFQEFRCCSPSDTLWEDNLKFVLEAVFADRSRSSATRVRALHTIMDAYEIMDLVHEGSHEFVPALVRTILSDVSEEPDVQVLEAVVSLMVSVSVTSDMDLFDYIVDTLRGIVNGERLKSPLSPLSTHSPGSPTIPDKPDIRPGQSASNVVAAGYVKLFVELMDTDSQKSTKMYDYLVNITKSADCETDARLTAMKFLFRLRSDWANRIFLTYDLETDSLAALLYRTKESLLRKQAESAAGTARLSRGESGSVGTTARRSRGISISQSQHNERGVPIRTASSAAQPTINQPSQQLWSLPDPDAIPIGASSSVSPLLTSYVDKSKAADGTDAVELEPLNLAAWLDTLLHLFQNGCDWEIYSYVLVHLPSQLSNHSIFRNAIPQVQELRKVLCEQVQKSSFSDPPFASGLRKTDIAICLLHSSTMILSYHRHFSRSEEDDLVRTFVHGIATYERSAKTCIHALSICCHELPKSTSKGLVEMLQKMAQIITQPQVAMHILEFLSGLCRMPDLYVNFREDEYRIVFGIAFRYLQYVRDKKQSHRSSVGPIAEPPVASSAASTATSTATVVPDSNSRSTTTDDLPQYVYTLAYHVITYWFLALKLPDRANYVGWISRNLFTDVESAHGEEQAIITMDFLRRVTYSDGGESAEDPLFTSDRFGDIVCRSWVVANSIMTIKQATGTGWAQLTKRQPSGTSSYMIRELFQPTPHHQTGNLDATPRELANNNNSGLSGHNHVLPSHVLVQLLSSTPQTVEAFKPIA
ncbi:DUF3384 domain-containing protein, partial [Candidatus Bathyarchaeota archaeon]|nr:DUF3384 domain-containing protein [Candidatus Bathyarchaeota archaeon]